jgi:hypothetical protein
LLELILAVLEVGAAPREQKDLPEPRILDASAPRAPPDPEPDRPQDADQPNKKEVDQRQHCVRDASEPRRSRSESGSIPYPTHMYAPFDDKRTSSRNSRIRSSSTQRVIQRSDQLGFPDALEKDPRAILEYDIPELLLAPPIEFRFKLEVLNL